MWPRCDLCHACRSTQAPGRRATTVSKPDAPGPLTSFFFLLLRRGAAAPVTEREEGENDKVVRMPSRSRRLTLDISYVRKVPTLPPYPADRLGSWMTRFTRPGKD